MLARRIATIDGKPVYKDHNGKLCIESNGFRHLRDLTEEEDRKLVGISRQLKHLVVGGDRQDNL